MKREIVKVVKGADASLNKEAVRVISVYPDGHLENKASLYLVNSKEMACRDLISWYDANKLGDVTDRKSNFIIQQYGEKAKNGGMIITTEEIN